MRTLAIVGCREAPVKETVDLLLNYDWEGWVFEAVVTGDAKGVDTAAVAYARHVGIPCTIHRASWDEHGKAAGMMRNQKIVDACDELLAIWDAEAYQSGTLNSIMLAVKAGKRVTILPVPKRKESEE